jgi:hypothetical protein
METQPQQEQIISPEAIYSEKILYLSSDGQCAKLPRAEITIGDIKVLCSQEPDGKVMIQTIQDGKRRLYSDEKKYSLQDGPIVDLQAIINENFLDKFETDIDQNVLRLQKNYKETRQYVETNYRSPIVGANLGEVPFIIQYLDPTWQEKNKEYEVEITKDTQPALKIIIKRYQRAEELCANAIKKSTNGRDLSPGQVIALKSMLLNKIRQEQDNLENDLRLTTSNGMYYHSAQFELNKGADWNSRIAEIIPAKPQEPYIKPGVYEPLVFEPIIGTVDGLMDPTTGVLEKRSSGIDIIDNEPQRNPSKLKNALKGAREIARAGVRTLKNNLGNITAVGATSVGALAYAYLNQGQTPEIAHNPINLENNTPANELIVEQKPLGTPVAPPSRPGISSENKPLVEKLDGFEVTENSEGFSNVKVMTYSEKDLKAVALETSETGKINTKVILKLIESSVDTDFYNKIKELQLNNTPLSSFIKVKPLPNKQFEITIELPKQKITPTIPSTKDSNRQYTNSKTLI